MVITAEPEHLTKCRFTGYDLGVAPTMRASSERRAILLYFCHDLSLVGAMLREASPKSTTRIQSP